LRPAVARGASRCALQVLDRAAQAVSPGAAQVLDRGAQAVARGGARCALQALDHGAQADARSAAQVLVRGFQAISAAPLFVRRRYWLVVPGHSRGAARCLSQVLNRGAKTVSRGGARCATQILDRGAQAVARDAATLSQQEKNNSADVKRNRAKEERQCSRRCTFSELGLLAAASRRRWRIFQP
jgi:hypothetical protein